MSDTSNPFGFSSFFFPNEQGTNLKLREKIALAQMMKKQAYPKTLGEGFASIGDSISDIITMRGLEKSDRDAQAVAAKLGAPQEAGAITPVASTESASPIQAASIASGNIDPTSQTPVPPSVQEGGPPLPPGPMFRPNLRTSTVQPPIVPAAPAVPAPPDVPGAIRTSTPEQLADFRAQNPLPQNIPPPPRTLPTVPQRPSVADYGQKLVLAPTPSDAPVMAKGFDPASLPVAPPDDPRREIALAMLRQGQTGQPPVSPPAPTPRGIEVAPPDAFQRVAQAQPQATPGYIPPELGDPTRAVVIPPGKRERELQLLLNANQGNPYAAQSPAAMELQTLQDNRAKQQALEDKKTEANITRATKREEQRQNALIGQDKSILESQRSRLEIGDLPAKLQQEAEKRALELKKARIPETRQDVETGLTFNEQTGQWEQPRIAGTDPDKKPAFKGTEFQGKALVNYGRARIAQEGLKGEGEKVLAGSPVQSALSSAPFGVGRAMRSDVYKEADTHAENYVQAFIRQQSGGAYTDTELEKEARAMLPKYGDTDKQLETKREQREQFLSGMYSIIGSSGQKGVDIDAARRETERAARPAGPEASKVLDFDNEAEVAKARLKPGTRIRVNGRPATVQ